MLLMTRVACAQMGSEVIAGMHKLPRCHAPCGSMWQGGPPLPLRIESTVRSLQPCAVERAVRQRKMGGGSIIGHANHRAHDRASTPTLARVQRRVCGSVRYPTACGREPMRGGRARWPSRLGERGSICRLPWAMHDTRANQRRGDSLEWQKSEGGTRGSSRQRCLSCGSARGERESKGWRRPCVIKHGLYAWPRE